MDRPVDKNPAPAPLSRGWLIAYVLLGPALLLDGGMTLLSGDATGAVLAEAVGQAMSGAFLAVSGALGLRGGEQPRGWGVTAFAALGVGLYVGGMVARGFG